MLSAQWGLKKLLEVVEKNSIMVEKCSTDALFYVQGGCRIAEFGLNLDLWQHYSTDFESDCSPGTPYASSRKMIFIKSL